MNIFVNWDILCFVRDINIQTRAVPLKTVQLFTLLMRKGNLRVNIFYIPLGLVHDKHDNFRNLRNNNKESSFLSCLEFLYIKLIWSFIVLNTQIFEFFSLFFQFLSIFPVGYCATWKINSTCLFCCLFYVHLEMISF